MARLDLSVGRLIEQNAIVIGGRKGWMIRVICNLTIPAGMAVTITDRPNGNEKTRTAVARDDLHTCWARRAGETTRVLFLSREAEGSWGLWAVSVPDEATALQQELAASLDHISFGE